MWKVNGWQTTGDGKCSYCLWQGELKTKKLDDKYKCYIPSKYVNFGNLGSFWNPFWNKIAKKIHGPSITHKDDHFAQKFTLTLDEN